ncbi:MAG: FAD:protein FMN transferase [Magnetococcales bacterium]|nr:FAD:protein FMN transferase [Magnetococcales bacterium]
MIDRKRLIIAGIVAALFIVALARTLIGPSPRGIQTDTRLLMGTLVTISVWGVEKGRAQPAMNAAFEEMARIEARMSRFVATSEVASLNAAERGTWQPLSEELERVVTLGMEIDGLSGGAFDIGLGPLSDLWGFSREPPPETPPEPREIRKWLEFRSARIGPGIEINEHRLRLANASVGLDLGGIAKGYAVDRAMEILEREGVAHALINAGGDMRIAGSKGGKPWHIGLRDPRQADGVVAVMDLKGSVAISTSGDYERFFIHQGVRHHHILDPATGHSARSGLMSVSIQASGSFLADALSTALFVLGETKGLALLEKFPNSAALLIREDGSRIQTPGFIAVAPP